MVAFNQEVRISYVLVLCSLFCFAGFYYGTRAGFPPKNLNLLRQMKKSADRKVQLRKSTLRWKRPILENHFISMSQENKELASYIRSDWILPPFQGKWNLDKPNRVHYSQVGQSQLVDKILNNRTNGFFIECGAHNGEKLSNSLFFEKSRNWTGLLVEIDPKAFQTMLKKKRHAWQLNAGLCPIEKAKYLSFTFSNVLSGFNDFMDESHKKRLKPGAKRNNKMVPCFPLLSVLNSIDVNHVDYFSLDTEGSELDILRTIPLDKITIDVISVEYWLGNKTAQKQKIQGMVKFLTPYGYKLYKRDKIDLFFVK